MRKQSCFGAVALAVLTLSPSARVRAAEPVPIAPVPDAVALFDEVWTQVRDGFVDPSLGGLDWEAVGARYRRQVVEAPGTWAQTANAMLAELETSHTQVYTADEPAYFQLLGVFGDLIRAEHPEFFQARFGDGPVRYPGIGCFTEWQGDEVVVTGVLEGLPAHNAGVQVGDVVLSVDDQPFRPVASFTAAVNEQRSVELSVRRRGDEAPFALSVMPKMLNAEAMFVDAMRASATVETRDGVEIAYVRAWSYSGVHYQTLLEELVRYSGPLAAADALVLDLRGGWGGASTEYLRLFARDIPVLSMRSRDGEWMDFDPQWRKPVVALIDGGTRSGKETLAWGFRHQNIGTLVGERTAGAVVGGRPHLLADGSVFYMAVADARWNGERLEGRGVAPDVVVPFSPRYAAGADPQRDRALEWAAEQVRTTATEKSAVK